MDAQILRTQRLEAIGTLAGGVAHDLNNVLAPILMGVELLKAKYPDSVEILDRFETSANRGAGMVRQLLTFAKGAEGGRSSIQTAHLIRELKDIMQATFPKNIQIKIFCEPNLPTVLGDATQLHQVLLNLCVNARDAMPSGGVLTMEARVMDVDASYAASVPDIKPGRYVALRVQDTGTGIAPEILDRIFESFFTTKAPDKGTGLGLSTVMGIVKGLGGFVRVASTLGRGAMFSTYLPAEFEGMEIAPSSRAVPRFFGRGETILLVDDEPAVLDVGRQVLTQLNFNAITAIDGTEGLVKVIEHRSELHAIIADMHMPHMDGLAFIRAARKVLPDIPVIVASGRLDESAAEELKALGVIHRLDKPFTQDMLAAELSMILNPKPEHF
jgi:CheY-like chemotaxis protein